MCSPLPVPYVLSAICAGVVFAANMLAASAPTRFEVAAGAQPQLSMAADGRVWLAYAKAGEIFTASSTDRGARFGEPTSMGRVPQLMVGMRRGPRIAAWKDRVTLTCIADELLSFRSDDGGKTWNKPVIINDVPTSAREGLHDLAMGPAGELFVTWLDLRNGTMELWSAESTDGGRSWQNDQQLYRSPDKTICTCCQPSALFDATGNLAVMWRNAIAGSRDMWLMTRPHGAKGFSSPRKLGEGSWKIDGCPMDGGRILSMGDGSFATVWQRAGETFFCPPDGPEVVIGPGKQPVAIQRNGRPVFVWQQATELVAGHLVASSGPTRIATEARFPVLISVDDGETALLAYEFGPAKEPNAAVERIRLP